MTKDNARIGKNDPCPCGSGKKYRRCCKGKGIRFALLDVGNKKFVYNVDEVNAHLTSLSHFCYNHIITPYNNKESMDHSTGLKILQELYTLLDKVLTPFLANSSCSKGCKECCNLVVETTSVEADMARSYIEDQVGLKARQGFISSIEEAADHYSDPALLGDKYKHLKVERYLHSELRCPFYTDAWTCGIYPARPLGCRTHIVYSSPQQCRTRKIVDYYDGTYFPHIYKAVECLSALIHADIRYEKHLPDWFVEEFKIRV